MGETLHPDSLASIVSDLRRRVHALETAPRAIATSVREGSFIVLDDDGTEIVRLGVLADGSVGLHIRNANGRDMFKVTAASGQVIPVSLVTLGQNGSEFWGGTIPARMGTTATSYSVLWEAHGYTSSDSISHRVFAYPNAGTMSWKLTAQEVDTSYHGIGTETDVIEFTGLTVFTAYNSDGTPRVDAIPSAALESGTGTDPRGRYMRFKWYAKRTAGAGNVDLLIQPAPLI